MTEVRIFKAVIMNYFKKLVGDRIYLSPKGVSDEEIEKFTECARVRESEWVLLWYVDSSSECLITVVIK